MACAYLVPFYIYVCHGHLRNEVLRLAHRPVYFEDVCNSAL